MYILLMTAAHLRVGLIRAGLCSSRLLCLPPLVLVHQLSQVGSLFRVADDQFMFQQFFGSWPLRKQISEQLFQPEKNEIKGEILKHNKTTHKTGLFVEAGLDKLLERFAVVAL